jgi:hypothetical protein
VVANIWELIDVQDLAGQEVLNVYHYLDAAGTVEPLDLMDGFVTNTLPGIVQFQTNNLEHTALRYRRVYPSADLTQEYTVGLPVAGGLNTGDDEPSSTALSMKWGIGATVVLAGGFTGHIKRGGMRLGGAKESMIVGNDVASGVPAEWAGTFPLIADPIGDASVVLIVASFLNGARVRQHTVQSYSIVTGSSAPSPSTQNTRKVLRGRTS